VTDISDWQRRIEASFDRQGALAHLGARLTAIALGAVEITLPFRPEVGQHLGFFHGGVIATVLDTACGMAALTRMDGDHEVVTAEFKLNFLAPAQGGLLIARGRVVKAGRILSVCTGEAFVPTVKGERQVALMQATMTGVHRPKAA
jgi:uncharacterized protein (TIGR00369 family)